MTSGWLPLEDAPRNRPIDLWVKGYPSRRIVNMLWDEHECGFRNAIDPEQGWMEDEEITHYRELPAAPND